MHVLKLRIRFVLTVSSVLAERLQLSSRPECRPPELSRARSVLAASDLGVGPVVPSETSAPSQEVETLTSAHAPVPADGVGVVALQPVWAASVFDPLLP